MKKRQAKEARRRRVGGVVTWKQVRGTHADTGGGLRFKRSLRRKECGVLAGYVTAVSAARKAARKSTQKLLLCPDCGTRDLVYTREDDFETYECRVCGINTSGRYHR